MQMAAIIVWIYGALVLAGGVMGWVKARSVPSLITGLMFGVALIVTGFVIERMHFTAICLTLMLAVMMGVRFAKTKKFMPAGMIAFLSVVVLGALLALR